MIFCSHFHAENKFQFLQIENPEDSELLFRETNKHQNIQNCDDIQNSKDRLLHVGMLK